MSIFGEYRHGSMDEAEFKAAARWEFRGDHDDYYCDGCRCSNCIHYEEGTETECGLPEGKCVDRSEFEPVDYPDDY